MADGILTPDEVEALTDRVKLSAQVRELQAMGIPHHVRRDGSPAVCWADVRPWDRSVTREEEPDYAALHG